MVTKKSIETFLAPGKIAFVGASRNSKKFGTQVYKALLEKGYELIPVHPEADSIMGDTCLKSISEVPSDIDRLYIVTPPTQTEELIKQANEQNFKQIWIQQKSETTAALKLLEEKDIDLISGKCVLMFASPVKGVHAFHRFLSGVFGNLPK